MENIDVSFFDPNSWVFCAYEYRIYGDDNASTWAMVDEIDYQWAIKWRWHINKPHPTRNGRKEYFRRSLSNGDRYMPPLYLHVEIMRRTGVVPPSELHVLVDHIDGDEWNCRRENLRWATVQQNNFNRQGKHSQQMGML